MDDVTSVFPARAAKRAIKFMATYREVLNSLNISAAPEDPRRRKAFDTNTSGELLGVWFDTMSELELPIKETNSVSEPTGHGSKPHILSLPP